MPAVVDCPSCNRKLSVPDELLGTQVQCPTCGSTFAARNGAGAPPPPAWQPRPASQRPRTDDVQLSRVPRSRRNFQPHRGPLILILGILSIVPHGLHLVLGPIAWILGNNDLREIRAGRMDPEGEGMTNAGRICGIIGTVMGLVAVLVLLLFVCIWFGLVAGAMAFFFGASSGGPPSQKAVPRPAPRPRQEAPLHPGIGWRSGGPAVTFPPFSVPRIP